VAALLDAVAGPDPRDPTTAEARVTPYLDGLGERLDGIRIGFVTNVLPMVGPEIRMAVEAAVPVLREAGAAVREIVIPDLEGGAAEAAMAMIVPEATHAHHAWLDERPNSYSAVVLERLLAGRQIAAVDYLAAREQGERLRVELADLQRELDLLVLPTMPSVAMPLDETTVEVSEGERGMTALNHLVSPFNLTGQPAISVPCGFTAAGLPIGLQIVGRHFEDGLVLRAAHAFQVRTDWHGRHPAALINLPAAKASA
jgi:aspartyl-tRNA(Asn)/glutamyl-tRNA(Gln) amidotransferase subunit A